MLEPTQVLTQPAGMTDPERFRAAQRCTLTSVAVNSVLSVLQITVGWYGQSRALMADGVHTLSDLLSDFLVLFANRHGAKAADEEHPYGHQRVETAATFLLGAGLLLVGLSILWNAGLRLQSGQASQSVHPLTLVIALVTLASKESLFHYLMGVARKHRSQMLAANAWHTRVDAATSLVGAVGIGGNLLGFTFLDTLAAALVAFMIARVGWKLGYSAMSELIDTGLSEQEVAAIRETLLTTPGVRGIHELRTRRMANQALVDAHVMVDPRISVSEGHYIGESARGRVLEAHPVLDVMVHVDPEDDTRIKVSTTLPGRDDLLRYLQDRLGEALPLPSKLVLHYLEGKVDAEVFLDAAAWEDPGRMDRLHRKILAMIDAGDEYFRSIQLHRTNAQ
ncbi:MAG: cation transporter [Betaproteobacteria bacterium]|nr:cation transporter [Betaproteobacteria bacterium]